MVTWISQAPPEWLAVAFLTALALFAGVLGGALVLIVRSLRGLDGTARRLHLQQATIVGMLLKAGFRPLKNGRDWFDDDQETRAGGALDLTKINWERPPPF